MKWLLLLLSTTLTAQISMEGSALYWREVTGGTDFAVVEQPDGREIFTLKPSYDWGFAAGGALDSPSRCHRFSMHGLYIQSDDAAQVRDASPLNNLDITVPLLRETLLSRYWTLRFRVLHQICANRYLTMGLFSSLRYSNLRRGSARFRGAGPELGFSGDIALFPPVRFVGSLASSAIIGDTGSETRIAPFLEARLALRVRRTTSCFAIGGELGWALDNFWGALDNFGYSGPYVSVGVNF